MAKSWRVALVCSALCAVLALSGCTKRLVKRVVLERAGLGCPSCGATSEEDCQCFADPFCAGFQLTRWTPLTVDDHGHYHHYKVVKRGPEEVSTPPADGGASAHDPAPDLPGGMPAGRPGAAPVVPPGALDPDGFPEDFFSESPATEPRRSPSPDPGPPAALDPAPRPGSTPPAATAPPPAADLFDERPDPAPRPGSATPGDFDFADPGIDPIDPAPMPKDDSPRSPPPSADDVFPDPPGSAGERAKSDPAPAPPTRKPASDLDFLFPESEKGEPAEQSKPPREELPDLFGDQEPGSEPAKPAPKKDSVPDDLFPLHDPWDPPRESVPQENVVKIRRVIQVGAVDEILARPSETPTRSVSGPTPTRSGEAEAHPNSYPLPAAPGSARLSQPPPSHDSTPSAVAKVPGAAPSEPGVLLRIIQPKAKEATMKLHIR